MLHTPSLVACLTGEAGRRALACDRQHRGLHLYGEQRQRPECARDGDQQGMLTDKSTKHNKNVDGS